MRFIVSLWERFMHRPFQSVPDGPTAVPQASPMEAESLARRKKAGPDDLSVPSDDAPLLTTFKGEAAAKKTEIASFFSKDYWRAKLTVENMRILVYFFLLNFFGIVNNVLGRHTQMKFGEKYAWFNNQFTTLMFCVLAQAITSYKYFFTKDITDEMKAFPVWKYVLFGAIDALAAFLTSIGGPNTPATLQNVVSQTVIPVTMVASFFILKTRYSFSKIGGATVILVGAFIALIPLYMDGNQSDNPPAVWYSVIVYISNNIPTALSNVLKERAFNQVVLDVYYVCSWVAWFQFGWGLLLLPVTMLPGFGGISASEMTDQIHNGYYCLLGMNPQPGDACEYNFIFTTFYILTSFAYCIFILLVTKHASATLFTLGIALRLPLSQIVFTLDFIMFQYTEPFNWETTVSLVVVLFGFAIYSLAGNPSSKSGSEEVSDIEQERATPSPSHVI